jgi:hypothetical protein
VLALLEERANSLSFQAAYICRDRGSFETECHLGRGFDQIRFTRNIHIVAFPAKYVLYICEISVAKSASLLISI